MMLMIGAALAVGAVIVAWSSRVNKIAKQVFDGIAVIALFVFFVIAATGVMETLVHDTVFMTEVHHVLLNPFFLASGAYLGPYAVGRAALVPASTFLRK